MNEVGDLLEYDRSFNFPILNSPPDIFHGIAAVCGSLITFTCSLFTSKFNLAFDCSSTTLEEKFYQGFITKKYKSLCGTFSVSTQSAQLSFIEERGWYDFFLQARGTLVAKGFDLDQWYSCSMMWESFYTLSSNLLNTSSELDHDALNRDINSFQNYLDILNVSYTPWIHILVHHIPTFGAQLKNLNLFHTMSGEGAHRTIKKWYRQSLKGTTGNNTNKNGLRTTLEFDWALLNLLKDHNGKF